MKKNNRWGYLAVGTVLLLFCGLIYGWSLFRAYFNEIYPNWTVSQLSMTFTISMVFFCVGSFAAGKLSAKLSPRNILIAAACLILTGFAGVSFLPPEKEGLSLMMLYVFYGVLSGSGVGFAYNCVIGTVNKWFTDNPGIASGILMMGFGFGALVLGGFATQLIGVLGLVRTFLVLGVLIFLVLVLGAMVLKAPEQQMAAGVANTTNYGDGPMAMLRCGSFWLFMLWCVVINIGGLMIVNSAAAIATAYGLPAILGMVVSVFNGAGRVIAGGVYDRKKGKAAMAVDICCMIAGGALLLTGDRMNAVPLILIGLPMMGICYGANPTICSTFINRYYGPKYFSVNFGIGMFNLVPAAIIGPMVSSMLIEKSGGSYETTFAAILICAALSVAVWLILIAVVKSENKKRSEPRPF